MFPGTWVLGKRLVMRLPCGARGPLSPVDLAAGEAGPERVRLVPFSVEGLMLNPAQAVAFLCSKARFCSGPGEPRAGADVRLGDDLRVWARAALLVLELLARGRFVSVVEKSPSGTYRAAWRLLLASRDAARLRALAAALPGVALGHQGSTAQELVTDFVQSCADGCVRAWVVDELCEEEEGAALLARAREGLGRAGRQGELFLRWLLALHGRGKRMRSRGPGLDDLEAAISSWLGPVWGEGGAFRTLFRLDPPEGDAAGEEVRAPGGRTTAAASPTGASGHWAVRFFLQGTDDPSLLVPAREVWAGGVEGLPGGGAWLQEKLLADLGRAARLFPPLERGLACACPEECLLDVHEAYRLLTEGAPLFEEYGFGVLLPAWWARGPTRPRLGIELRVRVPSGTARAGKLGMNSLLEYDWRVAVGDVTLDPDEFRRLVELKVPLVMVRGQWVELRPDEIRAALERWERRGGRMRLGEALRLGLEGSLDGVPVSVKAEGELAPLWEALPSARFRELPAPAGFRGQLRPYQVRGFSWLAFLRRLGMGACLADDMGLGKTIQLIALLLHDRETGQARGTTLLVCPTSLLGNWEREVRRFAPSLRVMVHHGPERAVGEEFARLAGEHDLVITSYSLVPRDIDTLRAVEWDGVVLDEAQNVKNPSARQAQAVRQLRSWYRVALTGTPVENHLGELWSIMDFLNPGYLGPAARFREEFAIPIER